MFFQLLVTAIGTRAANQLLAAPPQRVLGKRPRPQQVPPKREGSWRSHHGLMGKHGVNRQPVHHGEGGGERDLSAHWSARHFFEARASCAASSSILWQLWLCSFVRLTNSSPHALHAGDGKKTTEKPSVRADNASRKARSVEPTRTCTAVTSASRKHQSLRLLREYHLLSQRTISIMHNSDGRSRPWHELVTTSLRHRPHVRRRWLSPWTHCTPTEPTQRIHPTSSTSEERWLLSRAHRNVTASTQRMDPTPGTDGGIVHLLITRTHSVTRPHQQCSVSFCPRAAFHWLPLTRQWQAEAKRA